MQPKLPVNAGPVTWVGPDEKNCVESGLIHCIRLPKEAGPAHPVPALVLIHGWGGDESSMWIFKGIIPARTAAITPRAPLDLGPEGFAWFRRGPVRYQADPASLTEGLTYLASFLASLPHLYPIDPARLLLVGFSQGAAVGNGLTIARPGTVIGMASLAGMLPGPPDPNLEPGRLAGLPVFIAHGTRDETVPLSAAQQARAEYIRLGAEVTYREDHVGHKMSLQAIKELKSWVSRVIHPGQVATA